MNTLLIHEHFDFYELPSFVCEEGIKKLCDTTNAYLSRGQSIVVIRLVIRVAQDSTQFAMVEAGNVDSTNHRCLARACNANTVIGFDIAVWWEQISVQILRVRRIIGWFVVH